MGNLECPECHELRADKVDELCAVCLDLVQRRAAYWIARLRHDQEPANLAGEGEIP